MKSGTVHDQGSNFAYWHSKIPLTPFSRGKMTFLIEKLGITRFPLERSEIAKFPLEKGVRGIFQR